MAGALHFQVMSGLRGLLTVLTTAALLCGDARAVAPIVRDQDIERALKLAQARDDTRAQFHAPYIVNVNDATLERVEVITEFRRYVLTTEEQLRMGRWLFAQGIKDAQGILRPWRGRLSLVSRLRFHPHNTLLGLPPYELTIGDPDIVPVDVVRTPITALLSGKAHDWSAPLLGATIESVFDAVSVGDTVRPVRLSLDGKDVARVSIDFSKLE